jgi:hypothetical protein
MISLWLTYFLIGLTGFLTLGYGFPSLRTWERAVLGFLVGSVFYMVYLNTWVHLFGYLQGVYLCLGSMILQSSWMGWRQYQIKTATPTLNESPTSPPLKAYQIAIFCLVLSVQAGIVILNNNLIHLQDNHVHGLIFSQYHISHLSYPVDTFLKPPGMDVELNVLPNRFLYHFGYNLLNASFASLSEVPHEWIYYFTSDLYILTLFALVFLITFHFTKNYYLSLATLFILPFDSHGWPELSDGKFWALFPPTGTYIICSITLGLALLFLASMRNSCRSKRFYFLLAFIFAIALELINESIILTIGPAVVVLLWFYDRGGLKHFLGANLLAFIPIYWFGGLIGGVLRGDSTFTGPYGKTIEMNLRVRILDFLSIDPFYGAALPIYTPIHLAGNPVMLLSFCAFIALAIFYRKSKINIPIGACFFFLVFMVGLLIPGTISFGYPQDVDSIRYVAQTSWAMGVSGLISSFLLIKFLSPRIQTTLLKIRLNDGLLIGTLTLIFSFTYFHSTENFKAFYLVDFKHKFLSIKNWLGPVSTYLGVNSNTSYNVNLEQYNKILSEVKQQQLARNPLIPNYRHDSGKIPQITAIAGPDITVQEERFSEKATVSLDASKSQIDSGEITVYQWWLENRLISESEKTSVQLPIGEWEVKLIVKNKFRNRGTDTQKITVTPNATGLINRALAAHGGVASSNGSLPFPGVNPFRAIDGSTRCLFEPGKVQKPGEDCWITKYPKKDFYWQVDLGIKPANIKRIILYFRKGFEAAEQTNNLIISGSAQSNFKNSEVLGTRLNEPYPQLGSWILSLPETKNYRYIRISKTLDTYTSLAEVEVFCEK